MTDPSKRFLTIVLALGIVVLVGAILLGVRVGDRGLGQVTEKRLESVAPVTVTPAPNQSTAPYGPNWRQTQALAAAADPGFADPRVPPVPIPTAPPRPKYVATPAPATPRPTSTPTPNPNLPIWRRAAPLPTATPPEPSGSPSPFSSTSPRPERTALPPR